MYKQTLRRDNRNLFLTRNSMYMMESHSVDIIITRRMTHYAQRDYVDNLSRVRARWRIRANGITLNVLHANMSTRRGHDWASQCDVMNVWRSIGRWMDGCYVRGTPCDPHGIGILISRNSLQHQLYKRRLMPVYGGGRHNLSI